MRVALLLLVVLATFSSMANAEDCNNLQFCQRWMCEQNANRRVDLAKCLGISEPDLLVGGASSPLSTCNAQQTGSDANLLNPVCVYNGNTCDVGLRYDKASCDDERPLQLSAQTNKDGRSLLAVKAKSTALDQVHAVQQLNAETFYNTTKNSANCVATATAEKLPLCICDPLIPRDTCIKTIKKEVFATPTSELFRPDYFNKYATLFVQYQSVQLANLGVAEVPGARPDATADCLAMFPFPEFPREACIATSPTPVRKMARRRLSERGRALRASKAV